MHAVRRVGPLAAVMFASLLAMQASAQGSTATVTLTVPSGPTTVELGGTANLTVGVAIQLSNIICAPGAGTANVRLAVVDPNPMMGITYTLPSSIALNIAGPMAYSSAGPATASGNVFLNVSVGPTALAEHEHPLNVTATFSASDLQGCQALPAASTMDASDNKQTVITTGRSAMTTSPTGTGNATGTMTEPAFALPLAFQIPVILAIGFLVARRK
jgi:hypothetical protein